MGAMGKCSLEVKIGVDALRQHVRLSCEVSKMSEETKDRDWKTYKKQIKQWKKEKEEKKLKRTAEAAKEVPVEKEDESLGRKWTLSIALPASILLNAQSPELRTYLGGQIARAAAIFNVDEIVIYDEFALATGDDGDNLFHEKKKCIHQLAKILEYLECPQYLRKHLYPMQKDLQYAGLLNPLDSTHHLKTNDIDIPFREGVVSNKPIKDKQESDQGSFIYIGLETDIQIDKVLKPGVRVTVKFDSSLLQDESGADGSPEKKRRKHKKIKGKAVAPSSPRTELGLYWGYTVRIADSLSTVLSGSPFKGGYDLMIGTSEKGDNIDETLGKLPDNYSHCLVVFGGLKGIEAALDSDEKLSQIDDPRDLFGHYINTCPLQGSNTIRTEEAILITLAALRPRLVSDRSKVLK